MSTKSTRVGILGGSFNPVHIGHLVMAQCAREQFELERVLFVPCGRQPLKDAHALAPSRHRLAMLEFALSDNLAFEISDVELRREGPSYTIDTIREIQDMLPTAELFFIIGGDTLFELHRWKDIAQLLKLVTFVTVSRPGTSLDGGIAGELPFEPATAKHLLAHVAYGCPIGISSTDVRHRVAEAMSIRYLVPPQVEMYIYEHHLYQASE